MSLETLFIFEFYIFSQDRIVEELMQKIIEIEQHLLFFIIFFRVPKYRVRPIKLVSLVLVLAKSTYFK